MIVTEASDGEIWSFSTWYGSSCKYPTFPRMQIQAKSDRVLKHAALQHKNLVNTFSSRCPKRETGDKRAAWAEEEPRSRFKPEEQDVSARQRLTDKWFLGSAAQRHRSKDGDKFEKKAL